jgi:hypothetical protein
LRSLLAARRADEAQVIDDQESARCVPELLTRDRLDLGER